MKNISQCIFIACSQSLTADDVVILNGYPRVERNGLAIAFYVHSNGAVVNANILANAVRSSIREIETAVGFSVLSVEVLEPNEEEEEETNRKSLSLLVKSVIIASAGALLLIIAVITVIIFIILWYVNVIISRNVRIIVCPLQEEEQSK